MAAVVGAAMSVASDREVLEYLRQAMDDPRLDDEVWLEMGPPARLYADLLPTESGEPPAALACDPACLKDLTLHGLVQHRVGRRARLSITPLGRQALGRAG